MQSDLKEILIRVLKYLVEGIGVSIAAYYISKKKVNISDIVGIGITAASIFSILDLVSPAVYAGARFGAGFGIGNSVVTQVPVV